MKSLQNLNNVERAKLLFELHPESINGFIDYAKQLLDQQHEDYSHMRETWNNGMVSVELWISLLEAIRDTLAKYGNQVHKSKNLFSDQLFDGYLALVSTTLLSNYREKQTNQKFNDTITLLFT